ncbi:hypothetical protein Fcan01_15842 [Folsomia candida]|uniref:Gustatory receptor n=1 Tax=Folsomia candida TaxID=158441 RepID=A0A226DX53_FOLCA|nr:hypothetical protein Fcan01_15842 [Folsomia candida]
MAPPQGSDISLNPPTVKSSGILILALNRHKSLFRFLETTPISWTGKKFLYTSSSLRIWYTNTFLILISTTTLPSLYFLVRPIFSTSGSLPFKNFVVFVGILLCGIFNVWVNIAQILYGKEFVLVLNEFDDIIKTLLNQYPSCVQNKQTSNLDVLFKLFNDAFLTYVILCPVGCILYKLDPLYFLLKEFYEVSENNFLEVRLLLAIRYCFIVIVCSESCRLFPLIFILFLSGLRLCYTNLKILSSLTTRKEGVLIHKLLLLHKSTTILVRLAGKFQESVTLCLMGIGLVLSMLFNFAVVKGLGRIPLHLYWYIVSGTGMILIVIHILMLYPYRISDVSLDLLGTWVWSASLNESYLRRRYYRKKVRAMGVVEIAGGIGENRFYVLKRSTEVKYFAIIVAYTINLLLGIPPDLLDDLR